MSLIAVMGTLDTKGKEHQFVAEIIRDLGHQVVLIDLGTTDKPTILPDIRVSEMVSAFENPGDRGACVSEICRRAPEYLSKQLSQRGIDGVISLGGGGGTSLATAVMRALPLGLPKVMVSTLASGNTAHYIDISDIVMMPSIVDVAGLNRISKAVFSSAAYAVCSMAESRKIQDSSLIEEKPIIVASMFGNTTDCVNFAKAELEGSGFETLVFHATGTGGRTMESIINAGKAHGVLDITTTEVADEIVGGVLTAGSDRLGAAGRIGTPTVIVPGCVDMVNFGAMDTVPEKFIGRCFYRHNDQVTLMRTTPEENRLIAKYIAQQLNQYILPPVIILPKGGISVISEPGGPFHDPMADQALFSTLKLELRSEVRCVESDHAVNHPEFARLCVCELLDLISNQR